MTRHPQETRLIGLSKQVLLHAFLIENNACQITMLAVSSMIKGFVSEKLCLECLAYLTTLYCVKKWLIYESRKFVVRF